MLILSPGIRSSWLNTYNHEYYIYICLIHFRPSSDTALHILCGYGENHPDYISLTNMIDIGAKILDRMQSVNVQNLLGQTPLHIAISSKNTAMVDLLLNVPDIDINLRTCDEKCALELSLTAFKDENFTLASKLLKMGAKPNPLKSETNNSLLQLLALAGEELEDAAIFLADFADLNHLNNSGMSALHIAAKQNMPLLVTKLLSAGAEPNIQSSLTDLKTPLHLAVEINAPKVIEAFVNFRNNSSDQTDFNCKDVNGDSPLSLCLALDRIELAPILISGGADVNARNGNDLTLLHQSILSGDNEKAIFLLDQGADINALTGK